MNSFQTYINHLHSEINCANSDIIEIISKIEILKKKLESKNNKIARVQQKIEDVKYFCASPSKSDYKIINLSLASSENGNFSYKLNISGYTKIFVSFSRNVKLKTKPMPCYFEFEENVIEKEIAAYVSHNTLAIKNYRSIIPSNAKNKDKLFDQLNRYFVELCINRKTRISKASYNKEYFDRMLILS